MPWERDEAAAGGSSAQPSNKFEVSVKYQLGASLLQEPCLLNRHGVPIPAALALASTGVRCPLRLPDIRTSLI